MGFIIDRFEGEFALVELDNMDMVEVPSAILPPGSKEGDRIVLSIDHEETRRRQRRIEEKFKRLLWDD